MRGRMRGSAPSRVRLIPGTRGSGICRTPMGGESRGREITLRRDPTGTGMPALRERLFDERPAAMTELRQIGGARGDARPGCHPCAPPVRIKRPMNIPSAPGGRPQPAGGTPGALLSIPAGLPPNPCSSVASAMRAVPAHHSWQAGPLAKRIGPVSASDVIGSTKKALVQN